MVFCQFTREYPLKLNINFEQGIRTPDLSSGLSFQGPRNAAITSHIVLLIFKTSDATC